MANVDTGNGKPKRTKKAEHSYVDANGNEVDSQDEAFGYVYSLEGAEDVDSFEWDYNGASDFEKRMLALFGCKTLATNEASQVRNNPKIKGTAEASPANQMAGVVARFAQLKNGIWTSEREGGGIVTDLEKFASAICQFLVDTGKRTQADIDGGGWDKVRSQLEDKDYRAKARSNTSVMAIYAKLVGRQQATADDLDVV